VNKLNKITRIILFLLIFIAFNTVKAKCSEKIGSVSFIQDNSNAKIKKNVGHLWETLEFGDSLFQGDSIKVTSGYVRIFLMDSVISLKQGDVLFIEKNSVNQKNPPFLKKYFDYFDQIFNRHSTSTLCTRSSIEATENLLPKIYPDQSKVLIHDLKIEFEQHNFDYSYMITVKNITQKKIIIDRLESTQDAIKLKETDYNVGDFFKIEIDFKLSNNIFRKVTTFQILSHQEEEKLNKSIEIINKTFCEQEDQYLRYLFTAYEYNQSLCFHLAEQFFEKAAQSSPDPSFIKEELKIMRQQREKIWNIILNQQIY